MGFLGVSVEDDEMEDVGDVLDLDGGLEFEESYFDRLPDEVTERNDGVGAVTFALLSERFAQALVVFCFASDASDLRLLLEIKVVGL